MKVFHHNDNDGRASAAMLNLLAKKEMLLDLKDSDFIEIDYNGALPSTDVIEDDEIVYIVDYSFTKTTVKLLEAICEKTKYVVWLDHHLSSLEIKDIAEEICSYVELDINRSGALITYDLFIRGKESDDKYIEHIIKLVDDHDRWIHKYEESMLFNAGSIIFNTDPKSDIWHNPITYNKAIEAGKTITEYTRINGNNNVRMHAYEVTINNHRCIVLNTPQFSSTAFGDAYTAYKFAIRFNFNGSRYQYSFYSNLDDINCADIAKHINEAGGGHKGAAGCTSDKIEFLPGHSYWFR